MTELWLINALLGFITLGFGIALSNLYGRLKSQDEIIGNLHQIYAKREDVRGDFEIIRAMLQRIEHKLDQKQDKG